MGDVFDGRVMGAIYVQCVQSRCDVCNLVI
jgi:hypothetical protein